jgi:MFS family permease
LRPTPDNGPVLQRLGFPSVGEHGRFVTAIAVDTIGGGLFMPVSVLYFVAVTDLSLVEIGGAMSAAALISLPLSPVLGTIVDRFGARQVILWANLLQGAGFVAYLFTQSFLGVLLWTVVVSVGRAAFFGSYGNIVTAISAPGEREQWFGFLGAVRNIGYALGGLLSGLAVTIGTTSAYQAIVIANAASFAVSWFLLLALPKVGGDGQADLPGSWRIVLSDRAYLLFWLCHFTFACSMLVLNFAFPVYAVTVLGLPGWVTGAIFTINTVMVGFGQGLVVQYLTGRVRWKVIVGAQLVFATSYLLMIGIGHLGIVAGTVLILVGAIVYTLGELTGGPVTAAISAEAAPEHLLGRYLSLIQMSWGIAATVTPVAFMWLLEQGTSPMWLAMLGLTAIGSALALQLGRVMPRAADVITNRAEEPVVDGTATA